MQQMKVLMKTVQNLQQQQTQQQQQLPVEEPVAHSVPSRIAAILYGVYLPHLQSGDRFDTLTEMSNHTLGTPIVPPIFHGILLFLPVYIVSGKRKGCVHLLLLHPQILPGVLSPDYPGNDS